MRRAGLLAPDCPWACALASMLLAMLPDARVEDVLTEKPRILVRPSAAAWGDPPESRIVHALALFHYWN